jgi:Tfp pilus assembly PilM family ATPase
MRASKFSFTRRRCIAVDLGQSRIKAVLAERIGSRLNVLHAFTLDLQEEGLLTPEETNRHISRILLEMGDYPVSLVIPQHIAISHLIGLPGESKARWDRLIEEETQKLTGLSDSAIVYDYFRLRPFGKQRNPVWVTVSREKDLEDQIRRLRDSDLQIGEVTNTGNALASAYLATQPPERRIVLADIGAISTTVVVLERLQPVYATTFPLGGEMLTNALAGERELDFDEAENAKKTEFLFRDPAGCPRFRETVEEWRSELERLVLDWVRDLGEAGEQTLKVAVSGGSSLQAGFVDFLSASSSRFQYATWKDSAGGVDPQTYAVAFGAALAGLKVAPVSSSLLPRGLRIERARSRQVAALNSFAGLLLLILFGILFADASATRRALGEKAEWVAQLEQALAESAAMEDLLQRRGSEYNRIVPVVQQQQRTRDLLRTISLMQKVRAENDLWFVMLADGQSYTRGATVRPATPQGTTPAPGSGRGRPSPILVPNGAGPADSVAPGWNRFVVEVTIPGEAAQVQAVRRRVVDLFNAEPIFRNVDILPDAARRPIADTSVLLQDQTFSLNLELIPSELPVPVDSARPSPLLPRPQL